MCVSYGRTWRTIQTHFFSGVLSDFCFLFFIRMSLAAILWICYIWSILPPRKFLFLCFSSCARPGVIQNLNKKMSNLNMTYSGINSFHYTTCSILIIRVFCSTYSIYAFKRNPEWQSVVVKKIEVLLQKNPKLSHFFTRILDVTLFFIETYLWLPMSFKHPLWRTHIPR